MKKLLFGISTLMVFVLLFSSCTEDPPTADFLYTVDGLTVTFEDASELAADYEWDFGDGATSTEVNPIHTYAAEGTYTVKLTVTNEGGEDSRSESITVNKPSITIDGDFSDWDLYDVYYTGPSGTLKETRVTAANGFLFFYVKASAADAGPVIQVFFDKDNDGATGWDFWGAYETPGLEYLLEVALEAFEGQYGPTEAGSALFEATAEDWPWTITVAETDAVTESSGWITDGDDKILEFSVAQSLMPDLGTTVRMVFMNADNDWEEAGTLPTAWQDPPLPLDPIDL